MNELKHRKGSKNWYIDEIIKLLNEHKKYSDILYSNIDDVNIMGGSYYVYGTSNIYPYKWLYGTGMNESLKESRLYGKGKTNTKLKHYVRMFYNIKEEIDNIKKFLTDKGIEY